jgi:hypothetical protein
MPENESQEGGENSDKTFIFDPKKQIETNKGRRVKPENEDL